MAVLREVAQSEVSEGLEVKSLAELIASYTSIRLQPGVRSWRNVKACLSQSAMEALHKQDVSSVTTKQIVAVLDAWSPQENRTLPQICSVPCAPCSTGLSRAAKWSRTHAHCYARQ